MIIGSGLLAHAFSSAFLRREDVCIYAAGVSNSNCTDAHEFSRERQCLSDALRQARHVDAFVYFGTCSVADPDAQNTSYVQHKLAMEELACTHSRSLILRLPQVAGRTPNPHTLLNYLHGRISRGESFNLWSRAKRNIISIDDIVSIALPLIANDVIRCTTFNIANTTNYSMNEIVREMEVVVGKSAIYEVVDCGTEYFIDTSAIESVYREAGVDFSGCYLGKVLAKYYGHDN